MAGKKKTKSNTPERDETPKENDTVKTTEPLTEVKAIGSDDIVKLQKFSMSQRSGIVFPVARCLKTLRRGRIAKIIQKGEKTNSQLI